MYLHCKSYRGVRRADRQIKEIEAAGLVGVVGVVGVGADEEVEVAVAAVEKRLLSRNCKSKRIISGGE